MMRNVFFFMIFMAWLPPVLHAASPLPEFYYYDASEVPGPRGSIVRSEEVAARLQGAKGYRVLYRTTTFGGAPIIASTLLFIPEGQEAKPLGTAVWAHRTVGIRARCAPSILDDGPGSHAFSSVPGLPALLQAGNIVVAPDYVGLGATPSAAAGTTVHPYLLSSAYENVFVDAIEAAKSFLAKSASGGVLTTLSGDVVLYGHSEGSFAILSALPSFERLPHPEWRLRGFAVSAPPSNLGSLLPLQRTMIGQILTAYVTSSYARVYPKLKPSELVTPEFSQVAERVAELCIALPDERERQDGLFESVGLGPVTIDNVTEGRHLTTVALSEEWRAVFDDNVPKSLDTTATNALEAYVSQGGADTIVFPASAKEAMFGVCSYARNKAAISLYPYRSHDNQFTEAKDDFVRFVAALLADGTFKPPSNYLPVLENAEAVKKLRITFPCSALPFN